MTTVLKGLTESLDGYTGLSTDTDNAKQFLQGDLWKDLDFGLAAVNPLYGSFALDVWKNGVGTFTGTQATAGTGTLIAGPANFGSLLEIDSNSTTGAQGYQVQFTGHGRYVQDGQTLYFDAMLRAHDIATGPEFFAGFGTIDTTVISGSAISPTKWIGFYIVDDGKGVTFGMDDDSAVATHSADVYTLVDADVTTDGSEWVHLGFAWTAGQSCRVYVNGVDINYDGGVANDPVGGFMVPTLVCQSSGTTDPLIRVAHTAWGAKL